jgi:EmrB/QacA subfamily drug resistance transporter
MTAVNQEEREPESVDGLETVSGVLPQASPVEGTGASSWFVLATASATCGLITLDTNVVAVSLPSIARSFHAGFADVEWVVSAYMVAFASCLLPMGGLADRYGRKKMMIGGLVVFALASLGCGLAASAPFLNIARAVKGVGASMLLTAALAVIANAFPGAKERTWAWAVWGMTMGIATTLAPLVGGVISQWIGWRWIFLLNLPVCAVLIVCTVRSIVESRNQNAGRIDLAGSALFGFGLALGIWALIGTQGDGWTSVRTALRFAGCAILLATFVQVERKRAHPMVDLSLFSQPRFVAAVLGMFGYAACAQVMMTFLPLYLQNAFGWAAVSAGVGMLPFALAMIVGPYIGKHLAARLSIASVLSLGLTLVGTGNLLTAVVAGGRQYWLVAIGMIVTGVGAGILNGDTQRAIMACVPSHRTGMASGISTTTRFTAIVTSVGVLGAVLSWRTQSVLDQSVAGEGAVRANLGGTFMSDLLAGDTAHAMSQLTPAVRAVVESRASASFAGGFAATLTVAGALALVVACVVWVLAGRQGNQVACAAARS